MKLIICVCAIIFLVQQKSVANMGSKLARIIADTSSSANQQKEISQNSDFDNLLKSVDCNDTNYGKDLQSLKRNIELQLTSMIKRLSALKKDTVRSKPLIAALTKELKTYEVAIDNEATMLFWAYGKASMQGERVVSRNCYYLAALRKKLAFIKAINEKIDGSLLMGRD